MKKIDKRKINILKLIVEEYIETGDITGSKSLLSKHDLQVSSATVRNDMMSLEKMGLLFQPYNSAGRLPTTRGLRVFVDYLMEVTGATYLEEVPVPEKYDPKRIDDTLYELVKRVTRATSEVTFAYLPELGAYYYLGLSASLERGGESISLEMSRMIGFLEDKKGFTDFITKLEIPQGRIGVYIGEEIGIEAFDHLSLLMKHIRIGEYAGYLGIIGSTKMDYAYNITALRQVL